MNNTISLFIRIILQFFLLIIGIFVAVGLLFGALVLFMIWLIKSLWCRITKRKINPWKFNTNSWQAFYRYHKYWQHQTNKSNNSTKDNKKNEHSSWQNNKDITDIEFK